MGIKSRPARAAYDLPDKEGETMFRHILVPTDGSRPSMRAAKLAIGLAKSSRGRITALHVVAPFVPAAYADGVAAYPELYSPTEYRRITRARANRMLARVAKAATAAKVRCETVVVEGEREWKAIIAAAKSKRCDAIVMGTHGRHGLDALLLGSVTSKVLARSTRPVLVCR
jgi:nucleotide-binding universal stress UspA family protein